MKIFEVTFNAGVQEAAAGSFASQAGVFGKHMMNAMVQKILPGVKSTDSGPSGVDPVKAMKAQITSMANDLSNQWTAEVSRIMSVTKDPSTGIVGVTDFTKVPKRDLSIALSRTLIPLLQKLTGKNIKSIAELSTLTASDAMLTNDEKTRLASTRVAFDANSGMLVTTDPSVNPQRIKNYWANLIDAAVTVSEISNKQRPSGDVKIERLPTGKFRYNGRILNPTNPKDADIIRTITNLDLS